MILRPLLVSASFAFFGVSGHGADLSGRAIYIEDTKAVAYDLEKGVKSELVSFDGLGPISGLAVSEDGTTLAWHNAKDGKFYIKRLPDGNAFTVKVQGQGNRRVLELVVPTITGMALSPDGSTIAYSFVTADNAFVAPTTQPAHGPPVFNRQMMPCQAVNYFETAVANRVKPVFVGLAPPAQLAKMGQCQFGMIGNVASYPPKAPYKLSITDSTSYYYPVPTPRYFNSFELTWHQAMDKMTVQRDAILAPSAFTGITSWQKGVKLLAIMRKSPEGFGPLEIYDMRNPEDIEKTGKAGFYDIRCSLSVFYGLAWTPEGSLLIKGDNGAWKIPGEQILQGIEKSGIGVDVNSVNIGNAGRSSYGYKIAVAMNNSIGVRPQPFNLPGPAKDIYCLSETCTLFIRPEGLFWFEETKGGKVAGIQPNSFSFCRQINALPANKRVADAKVAPGIAPEPVKKSFVPASKNPDAYAGAVLRSRKTTKYHTMPPYNPEKNQGENEAKVHLWSANFLDRTDAATGKYVRPTFASFDIAVTYIQNPRKRNGVDLTFDWVYSRHEGETISYALVPKETANLDTLDPTKLQYRPIERMPFECFLEWNQAVILEYGPMYVGLKPERVLTPKTYKFLDKASTARFFSKGMPLKADFNNWWLTSPKLEEEYAVAWNALLELMKLQHVRQAESKAK